MEIGVEAGLDEMGDDALIRQNVQDVGTIDQGEDEQQRRAMLDLPVAGVVEELQPVLLINDFGGGGPLLHPPRLLDDPRQPRRAADVGEPFVAKRPLRFDPSLSAAGEDVHDRRPTLAPEGDERD